MLSKEEPVWISDYIWTETASTICCKRKLKEEKEKGQKGKEKREKHKKLKTIILRGTVRANHHLI